LIEHATVGEVRLLVGVRQDDQLDGLPLGGGAARARDFSVERMVAATEAVYRRTLAG